MPGRTSLLDHSGEPVGSGPVIIRTVSGRAALNGPAMRTEIMLRGGRRSIESADGAIAIESDADAVSAGRGAATRRSTQTSVDGSGVQSAAAGGAVRHAPSALVRHVTIVTTRAG